MITLLPAGAVRQPRPTAASVRSYGGLADDVDVPISLIRRFQEPSHASGSTGIGPPPTHTLSNISPIERFLGANRAAVRGRPEPLLRGGSALGHGRPGRAGPVGERARRRRAAAAGGRAGGRAAAAPGLRALQPRRPVSGPVRACRGVRGVGLRTAQCDRRRTPKPPRARPMRRGASVLLAHPV